MGSNDTVFLTAGCAKYPYNKLDLGDIGGIPRVLDAGQCNDNYSLVVIAMKRQEVFGLNEINDLPISYDIAWYEQKAVAVLLALFSLDINPTVKCMNVEGHYHPDKVDISFTSCFVC